MSKSVLNRDKFRRPEILLREFLFKGARGLFREKDELVPFLHRALVLKVDVDGSVLENESGANGARLGPDNPPNSIVARVITDGYDKFTDDDDLKIFWPFFPESIAVPIKPNEHVYVVYEDTHRKHGLWVSKIPGHDNLNMYEGKLSLLSTDDLSLRSKLKLPDAPSSKKYNKNEDAAEHPTSGRLTSKIGLP